MVIYDVIQKFNFGSNLFICNLKCLKDDGQMVEPEHYCPIVPMVLINGAEGIGTGWAVKIPNFNIKGNFFFCFFKKSKFICYKNTPVVKLFFSHFLFIKNTKKRNH
jgi:hypothetical protein